MLRELKDINYLLNNNTVEEKLDNAYVELNRAKTELEKVLEALKAIMPNLPGTSPLKAENELIKKANKNVCCAEVRILAVRYLLKNDPARRMR